METATLTQTASQNTAMRMVTPVTILWKSILMLPIVGVVDSKRCQEIMEIILTKIMDTESKIVILDIQGVAVVDSAVANHLIKITNAAKLMGSKCIVTGMSSAIAQILVHLGVDLGPVITRATLKDGLEHAFDTLGLEVREKKSGAPRRVGN